MNHAHQKDTSTSGFFPRLLQQITPVLLVIAFIAVVYLYFPFRNRLQFDGDVLVGATAVGLTAHVGALRGLIQSRTRLGHWKQKLLETPTRFVEAFVACQRPNS
jgi:hypothetical protein